MPIAITKLNNVVILEIYNKAPIVIPITAIRLKRSDKQQYSIVFIFLSLSIIRNNNVPIAAIHNKAGI